MDTKNSGNLNGQSQTSKTDIKSTVHSVSSVCCWFPVCLFCCCCFCWFVSLLHQPCICYFSHRRKRYRHLDNRNTTKSKMDVKSHKSFHRTLLFFYVHHGLTESSEHHLFSSQAVALIIYITDYSANRQVQVQCCTETILRTIRDGEPRTATW